MTRTLTIAYRFSHQYKERIFGILVTAIIVTVGCYVFLLQKAIINVVERQQVVTLTKSASVEVSDLETEYFASKNMITKELARAKGLKEAHAVSYISKKSLTAMAVSNEL